MNSNNYLVVPVLAGSPDEAGMAELLAVLDFDVSAGAMVLSVVVFFLLFFVVLVFLVVGWLAVDDFFISLLVSDFAAWAGVAAGAGVVAGAPVWAAAVSDTANAPAISALNSLVMV